MCHLCDDDDDDGDIDKGTKRLHKSRVEYLKRVTVDLRQWLPKLDSNLVFHVCLRIDVST